jgi:two-component system, NtrC family, response regulator
VTHPGDPALILIVDDDASVTTSLALLLKQAGYSSRACASAEEALGLVRAQPFELVLQDMNFSRQTSGAEGLDLLARIKALRPEVPVILITAWGSIDLAVQGMKAGAADFVTKPWTNPQIQEVVRTALGLSALKPESAAPLRTREELDSTYDLSPLVGRDPKLLRVLDLAGRVAATDASVLILGESGTGKELVAEALHRNSSRRSGPFVKVNLGGIAVSLFESEIFGHRRGAFTDAKQDRKGRFETAQGGTIFLDELGELDLSSQVKLLRVLQDRTYEVLGSSQSRTVDARVISATNRNLVERVAQGAFREDLLYRLNLITLHLPALRERADDIPLLSRRFATAAAEIYGRPGLSVSALSLRWLQGLPWPGNVRQLKQWIERTVLVTAAEVLEPEHFAAAAAMEGDAAPKDSLPAVGSMTIEEIEKAMIVKSLRHHGGNLSRVAEALGLSRPALYRRLEKYGLEA